MRSSLPLELVHNMAFGHNNTCLIATKRRLRVKLEKDKESLSVIISTDLDWGVILTVILTYSVCSCNNSSRLSLSQSK
jgi:hypothetical protein